MKFMVVFVGFLKRIAMFDVFPSLCRFIGLGLFVLALMGVGFPPKEKLSSATAFLFILSVFFLLVPIAKRMSIGKLLTYERDIEKVKSEVTEFKRETKEFLNVYSNMITAISNTVSQTVNVHLPGKEQVREVKEELKSTLNNTSISSTSEDEIENFISQSGNDLNFALARLRMEIERSLRTILGHKVTTSNPAVMNSKFLSARSLFKEFLNQYPNYQGMYGSFDYILKVCNAAIHGQSVPENHASEAIYMGVKMLQEFEGIESKINLGVTREVTR